MSFILERQGSLAQLALLPTVNAASHLCQPAALTENDFVFNLKFHIEQSNYYVFL